MMNMLIIGLVHVAGIAGFFAKLKQSKYLQFL